MDWFDTMQHLMRSGRRRLLATTALALCAASPWVIAAEAMSGERVAAAEARARLSRIQEAATLRSYQGTLVFSAGGTVTSARILHLSDGVQQLERIDTLGGQVRQVIRRNDLVHTLWPQNRVAVIEPREPTAIFPALLNGSEEHALEAYELRLLGVDRVAGYEAQVWLLQPRDKHRYAVRLWVERVTHLLLRQDVVGARDEVLESSSFSEVSIGVRASPDAVLQPLRQLDGYRTVRPTLTRTQLDVEGWYLKTLAPGFNAAGCVRRSLDGAGSREGGSELLAIQAIYSDGVTHVSIFIEPFDATRHTKALSTTIGATHTIMRRQGDAWVTVVGDVPPSTAKLFADALERRKKP